MKQAVCRRQSRLLSSNDRRGDGSSRSAKEGGAMDFGLNLLTRGITGGAEGLLAMARTAEALGFGHVTANDHKP